MATTVAAYGKVKTAVQRGETLPRLDDRSPGQGRSPIRSAAIRACSFRSGGYKGYGLALVFGLLAGTLNARRWKRNRRLQRDT